MSGRTSMGMSVSNVLLASRERVSAKGQGESSEMAASDILLALFFGANAEAPLLPASRSRIHQVLYEISLENPDLFSVFVFNLNRAYPYSAVLDEALDTLLWVNHLSPASGGFEYRRSRTGQVMAEKLLQRMDGETRARFVKAARRFGEELCSR